MAANDKDMIKLAKDSYDSFSKGDLNAVGQSFAENVNFVVMSSGEVLRSRAEVMNFIGNFKAAFPDMKIDIKRQLACGDQVITEFVGKGTHKNPFKTPMGDIAPTGRKVEIPVCEIARIENGLFTDVHQYWDGATLMSQLGVINISEEHHSY